MNSCESYQELISRLVDGEISRDEHEALMAHMKTCSRCNAMYAVFHDLSDLLAEEPEELPDGLHEEIMAGVRRSAIVKKNRRMRTVGLRTALTAAACLVLVLFAASGFAPGRRAESVSIRSEKAAVTALPSETPAPSPEMAAPAEYLPPAPFRGNSPAPTAVPVQTAAPVVTPAWTPAPQTPDAYAVSESQERRETAQPTQQNEAFYTEPVTTPAPAPAVTETPAPVQFVPAAPETQSLDVSVTQDLFTDAGDPETSAIVTQAEAPDGEEAGGGGEDVTGMSLFESFVSNFFADAAPEDADEAEAGSGEGQEEADALVEPEAYAMPEPETFTPPEPETFVLAEPVSAPEELSYSLYGKDAHDRVLALLGGSADSLPEEAELTRLMHIALLPADEFGTQEKLEVHIYGDFVFYERIPAQGGSSCYRAGCGVRELESLLASLSAAQTTPSPAPTADPFGGEAIQGE